jgi:hypothetical protein
MTWIGCRLVHDQHRLAAELVVDHASVPEGVEREGVIRKYLIAGLAR